MLSLPRSRQAVGLAAGVIGFLAVLAAPTPEGLELNAQKAGAIAALMICWWISEAVHIGVTGLVPLVLFPLLGVESSRAISAHYGNHLIFLFVGGFIIAHAMEAWNLHRRIALNMISWFGSRPRPMILGFMITTAALSMWISNTATTMMLLPMAMAVVNQLSDSAEVRGYPADDLGTAERARDAFGSVLLLGIAYSASIGGIGTIVGSPTNVAFLGFVSDEFPELPPVSFAQWSMVCLPIVLLFLPLTWLYLCRFGTSIPISAIRFSSTQGVIQRELAALGPMSVPERRVLTVAALTGLLWVCRAPLDLGVIYLPGWSQLLGSPDYVHDSTVAMAMAVLLFALPSGQADCGGRLLEWKGAARGIPWGIVFLLGGGFALAAGISNSGLATWIGSALGVLENSPGWFLVLAICLLTTAITETTSNVASVLMLSPVLGAMALEIGVHPYLLLVPMAVTASFAFTLPVATPPNAIIFSSGWIGIPQMARAGIVLDALGVLGCACCRVRPGKQGSGLRLTSGRTSAFRAASLSV